jgi:hypothetical protein
VATIWKYSQVWVKVL